MSTVDRPLDSHIEIITPEHIAFQYHVAGPFTRLPAYLIDGAVRTVLVAVLSTSLVFALATVGLEGLAIGLSLVLWFVVSWFYGGLFETLWNGQTPGKRLMMLRVVSIDGRPINALQAVLRNVLRSVDAMPFAFYLVGLAACLLNRRYQRLGDLACGTMVVLEQRRPLAGVADVVDPRALALAERLPVDFSVSSSLARALIQYVQCRQAFSPVNREGIARHLGQPLRERLKLAPGTPNDLVLCALYHRAFLAERPAACAPAEAAGGVGQRFGGSASAPPEPSAGPAHMKELRT